MNITRDNANKVFVELGFKTSPSWPDEKIQAKLSSFGNNVDGSEDMETEEGKKLLKDFLAAIEKGDTLTLETKPAEDKKKSSKPAPEKGEDAEPKKKASEADSDEDGDESETTKKPVKKPAAKPDAKKPATKPAAPAKKALASAAKAKAKPADEKESDSLPKDKFGNREGTDLAKINAVFSKKPKDLAKVTEESGVRRGRCRRQAAKLLAKKFIKVDKESGGWVLAKE